MDRIASLRLAAERLRTQTYRYLPFGYRFARALTAMSAMGRGFGVAIGALFLKAGVQGMPDPGTRWNPSGDVARSARTLPDGYLADFGDQVFRVILRSVGSPDAAEDVMMDYLNKIVLAGRIPIRDDKTLAQAKSYVLDNVQKFIKSTWVKENRRKRILPTESLGDSGDEDDTKVIEIDDPSAMRAFDEFFDSATLRAAKAAAAKVLPWAPAYLDMLMDGVSDKEIIGDPVAGRPSRLAVALGMDPPYLTNPKGQPMTSAMWSKANGYKDKIWAAVKSALSRSGVNVEIDV